MNREDMADYFARLRAAPAQLPAPPAAAIAPPPIAQQVGKKGKRRKVQSTLV